VRVLGALLLVTALLAGIVPQFSDCQSQGRELTLADGRNIPMKCHWTARAEIAMAIPVLASGLLVLVSKRRETLRNVGILGAVSGVGVVLLPRTLIGVCGNPDMVCNAFMLPFLTLVGSVIVVAGAATAVMAMVQRGDEMVAEPATGRSGLA
jgi:hypothetical protein